MTDTILTSISASDRSRHLEHLTQQLDDRDRNEAIALIGALLDRRHSAGNDGPVRHLVPVVPRPIRPTDD